MNRWIRLAVAMALVVAMTGFPAGGQANDGYAMAPPTPGNVTSFARTADGLVVWSEDRGGGEVNSDVFAAYLAHGVPFVVADGPANQIVPDIDDGVAVWLVTYSDCPPCGEVQAKNLVTGETFSVAAPNQFVHFPAISGSWVVWATDTEVMARDIGTMGEPIVVARAPQSWHVGTLAIDGDRVIWSEETYRPNQGYPWKLRTARIGRAVETIASGVNQQSGLLSYDLAGGLVVYAVRNADLTDGPLVAHWIGDGHQATISNSASYPTTDSRYVFWQTTMPGRLILRGHDLQTASAFDVPIDSGSHGLPDLEDGALVWERAPGADFVAVDVDIRAAWLHQLLPTGRRPEPGNASPNWLYFPETGHYLAFGFKGFWLRSGGLPVFGYPLTEEFSEQGRTVQYLERQRFEYHPEHRGSPYETELGRLGAEAAARQGLLDLPAFDPLPASTSSGATCQFFAETGHRLCAGFESYWQSHGLEFGDPGVSFRESLALFGYPISEEFSDPATGLTVQYFERARFEYHPNNPEPYRVLLGRLGADRLALMGW